MSGSAGPGDIHVHTFGTATLSFAAGIKTKPGDVFEISAPEFGLPLVNPLRCGKEEQVVGGQAASESV